MKSSVVYKIPIKLIRYCSKNLLALVLSIAFVIPIKASPLTFCPLEGDAACDDVCNIIGEDDQDETDISTVEDEWFASCIRVRGTLIINENTDLDNQQFIMDPGSEIVVKGGYRLTLSSSLLQAGCEYLWKGIRVEDGATLKIYFSRIT